MKTISESHRTAPVTGVHWLAALASCAEALGRHDHCVGQVRIIVVPGSGRYARPTACSMLAAPARCAAALRGQAAQLEHGPVAPQECSSLAASSGLSVGQVWINATQGSGSYVKLAICIMLTAPARLRAAGRRSEHRQSEHCPVPQDCSGFAISAGLSTVGHVRMRGVPGSGLYVRLVDAVRRRASIMTSAGGKREDTDSRALVRLLKGVMRGEFPRNAAGISPLGTS